MGTRVYRIIGNGGQVLYYNNAGMLHRTKGPAIQRTSGSCEWWVNGELHRTDGPAIEWKCGDQRWYIRGHLHRVNGPAVIDSISGIEWWVDGTRCIRFSQYVMLTNSTRDEVASLVLKYGKIG